MLTKHARLDLSQPRLMAIMNATPDSFSDGGLLYKSGSINREKVLARLELMVNEGADIIDIGGESTRPGADPVSVQEELERVSPIVEWALQTTDLAISVDTSSPEVITQVAAMGAHLINDVRALSRKGALKAAANTDLAICLMHMQGSPTNMQNEPSYFQVVADVSQFLQERINACLGAGIKPENICIDPGFGFGKMLKHNLALLHQLSEIGELGFPVLVGLSRKSMIGQLLKRELVDRLPASLALALMSLERGAKILRVHDIRATRDIIDTFIAVNGAMTTTV
ncbi:MAG: dihydropteroate synthase [Kiritimatiellia bacterium]|jgi:dihydropteroate synthase